MSLVKISGNASGTGTLTIAAPNTNTDYTLTLPTNTGTILTTATGGIPINGPAFGAYANANTTLSVNVSTKIQFQVEEFDTANCYDNATNYRFTPNVAGYYQISTAVQFGGSVTSLTSVFLFLYKNGSEFKRTYIGTTSYGQGPSLSTLIYMNGSTDYVEIYGQVNASSGSPVTNANQAVTWFQGALVRAA
jgi:hypothetical protein